MHLENEMIKVVDFEKIILQMKEEYSQLEKENQDVSIKMQNMEKKLNINVTNTANNIHKTCQEKIKELVDQIAEKDLKIEVIKEAVESKENQLKQGLRTIRNYMEELEAKQIDIQDLQLQLQENFVPHEPQSLAAELDDTNSLDYSGDEGHLVNVLIVAILTSRNFNARAEIQWNEIEASNQLRLEALAEEVELAKSELTKAQNLVSKRAESDLVVMSAVHALGMCEQRDKKK
ncbi:hypothetical protein C8J57DRAFT_1247492 [Mycena rebaudengoi]|nr:hypothetical protein C8J57DRAFT_1247492 [Mycena rebaudengoi]